MYEISLLTNVSPKQMQHANNAGSDAAGAGEVVDLRI